MWLNEVFEACIWGTDHIERYLDEVLRFAFGHTVVVLSDALLQLLFGSSTRRRSVFFFFWFTFIPAPPVTDSSRARGQ